MIHTENGMQILEWLGMRIAVPCDWEIVRHAVKMKTGRLVLIDRQQQRMQLAWTECGLRPDINRIFSDIRNRDCEQVQGCTLSEMYKSGLWRCYYYNHEGSSLTRGGMYDGRMHRWIDIVLSWPHNRNEALERSILTSFCVAATPAKGLRWQAFHLDFKTPPGWNLLSAQVQPANVTMTFEKNGTQASVTRIGLPETWFDGHLENFLKYRIDNARGEFSLRMIGRHEACTFTGRERRFRARWMIGKRFVRNDVAWHCEKSHAVYQVMTMAPRRDVVSPDMFAINCCGSGSPRQTTKDAGE